MNSEIRRVLCATAPVYDDARFVQIPHRIAVLPWSMPEPAMTVMVRLTVPLVAGRPDETLGVLQPGPFHAMCSDEHGPDDFVPVRPVTDVIVVGNVPPYPRASGAPTTLEGHVKVGYAHSFFNVERDAVQSRPLAEHAKHMDGNAVRIGPKPTRDAAAEGFTHPVAFDYEDYQATGRDMRTTYPEPGDRIETRNLVAGVDEAAVGNVPVRAPRVMIDPSEAGATPYEIPMDLDTVTIDLDRAAADLTYRGVFPATFQARNEIDRIIVAFATPDEWAGGTHERWHDPLRRLCRGTFRFAEERRDIIDGTPPPELTEEQLTVARYESWDGPGGPEPTLDVATFASIQSELAEQREPRADVLARHDLDDYRWNVEERAWTEVLAEPSAPDRDVTFAKYETAKREAEAKYATPEEKVMPIARFATIRARVESTDPMGALAKERIGLGSWMRIESAMQDRADADPAVAEELELALEGARARQEAEHPIDADPDPEPEETDPEVTLPEKT